MSALRVFLLTCRRPALLLRALASLRAQTFTDWVCELHNDAPEDDFPRRLVAETGDPRITLHHHEYNWGAVASFNHAYAAGLEPYAAILEDDNTWDAAFLAATLSALAAQPAANVAWANLRLSQEQPDGTWCDTGRTIWEIAPGDDIPRLFHWPQPLQFSDALHSHGAMVFRAAPSRAALVPSDTPLAIIEPVRERLLSGGWLLLPQPLGNFALTLHTARSDDRTAWARAQLLVAASYLAARRPPDDEYAEIWRILRAQRPPSTPLLFHLALSGMRPFALLRHARPVDWLRFLTGAARHPLALCLVLRFRSAHPALWRTLRAAALARTRENAALPPSPPLFAKRLSS